MSAPVISATRQSAGRGRGYFGVAVWHPKTEHNIGTLWRSAMLYDAAFVATVGRRYHKQSSDTSGTHAHLPLLHFIDLDDLIGHLPHSCPLVGVELDPRATPLHRFCHPQRALYLLGAEDYGLPTSVLDRCHHIVQIPTPRAWSMNVASAGTVVLYDRHSKVVKL